MRVSVLKEFVLRASVLKDWRVACFPPFEADESYRVSVLQSTSHNGIPDDIWSEPRSV